MSNHGNKKTSTRPLSSSSRIDESSLVEIAKGCYACHQIASGTVILPLLSSVPSKIWFVILLPDLSLVEIVTDVAHVGSPPVVSSIRKILGRFGPQKGAKMRLCHSSRKSLHKCRISEFLVDLFPHFTMKSLDPVASMLSLLEPIVSPKCFSSHHKIISLALSLSFFLIC